MEALPVQHPHAAGIDIGSRSHWVCVGFTTAADSCLIQEFPAHTAGLKAIAAFLHEHQVNTIAMESTGIYWIPLYELLQAEGLRSSWSIPATATNCGVSRFATVKKFCSWLGLCPNWKKTGGRVESSRTHRGVNRTALALRLAAQSLHHSQGALGGFLRRMKGRLGVQAALTATAHKLAQIVYLALKHGMTYVRQSQEEYEAQMKEKQIKALRRKARQLGLEVIEKTPGSVATAAAASVEG